MENPLEGPVHLTALGGPRRTSTGCAVMQAGRKSAVGRHAARAKAGKETRSHARSSTARSAIDQPSPGALRGLGSGPHPGTFSRRRHHGVRPTNSIVGGPSDADDEKGRPARPRCRGSLATRHFRKQGRNPRRPSDRSPRRRPLLRRSRTIRRASPPEGPSSTRPHLARSCPHPQHAPQPHHPPGLDAGARGGLPIR